MLLVFFTIFNLYDSILLHDIDCDPRSLSNALSILFQRHCKIKNRPVLTLTTLSFLIVSSITDEINTNNCKHTVSYNCIFCTHSQFYLILLGGYTFNFQFLEHDEYGEMVRRGRERGWRRGRGGWRGRRG